MTKIYIIAGENSGDFIGSKIMERLKELDPLIDFCGIGGKLMEKSALSQSLFLMDEINIMGFFEIIPRIFKLKKLIKKTINDILIQKPDLLITIDSPGFTFRVANYIKQSSNININIVHIVAPSVWAYKPGRAKKYAKIYDHLLTLLPFEPPYFEKYGLPCTYIGHPFLEQKFYSNKQFNNNICFCVTPGSRKKEIENLLPIFIESLNIIAYKYPQINVTFVLAQKEHEEIIIPKLSKCKFNYNFSLDKLKTFGESNFALAKSGTNTLEISASHTPLIIAYKINLFSYFFIRLLIKIKYVSLINIIGKKTIIPEFIQYNCTPEKIAAKFINMLENPKTSYKQVNESLKILNDLGLNKKTSPSLKAAKIILKILQYKL